MQAELVAAVFREAKADEASAVRGHEVHGVRRRMLGGDRQVALVLAVGRVADDDELSVADVLDRLLDGGERRRARCLSQCRHQSKGRPAAASSRATYLPMTSASRFTSSPGPSSPSVVVGERVRDERDGERVP